MLALELCRQLSHTDHVVIALDREQLDITSSQAVLWDVVHLHKPNVVVNCAAYNAVDDCELTDCFAKAFEVNVDGPLYLARACRAVKARLIHISSDFVFNGETYVPYKEDVQPQPISQYGFSKYKGEQSVQLVKGCDWVIVRTAWLYGPHGKNFVKSIYKLACDAIESGLYTMFGVTNEFGSPTYTVDLARWLIAIISKGVNVQSGVYHLCNHGVASRYEMIELILDEMKRAHPSTLAHGVKLHPISARDAKWMFHLKAPRPTYSVLDCTKAMTAMPELCLKKSWRTALRQFLTEHVLHSGEK